MALTLLSKSAERTREIGEAIGRLLVPGTVVKLTGSLGSGKTALAQGLARGLDVPPEYYVTSPTFTLLNQYPGRIEFFHADLYRLDEGSDLEDIGLPEVLYGDSVVAVEWAQKLPEEFENQVSIRLQHCEQENWRTVRVSARGNFSASFLKKLEMSGEFH